ILPLQSIDPRSAYIFWFAQKSESSELLLGDMPLESRYGYVFSKALDQQAYHTIAHELAHGVFSLRHTFSKDYAIAQGSTRNLMDYPTAKTTNATELKKYQWDALHDPKKLIAPWMQNEEEGEMIASKDKDSISVKIIRLNAEFAPGVGELAIEYSLNKKTMNIIEKYPNENFDIILAIADNKDNIVYMHEQKAKEKEILTWNGFKDKDMKLPILYKNGPYKINISLIGGKKIESFSSIKSWQDFKDILYQKFYDDSLMYISTSIDTIFNILTDPIKLDWLAYNESFPSSKSTQWYADFVVNCKSKGYFTDSLAKPLEWLINKGILNTSASFCGQEVSEILPELAEMINLADSYLKNNYPDLYQLLVNSKKYIPGPATGVSMRYTSNGPSLHSFGASVDFRPTYNPYIN